MAGRGRLTVEDRYTNQYCVLMDDEEDQMFGYCIKATELSKSSDLQERD